MTNLIRHLQAWRHSQRDRHVDIGIVEAPGRHSGLLLRILCIGRIGRVPYLIDRALEESRLKNPLGRLPLRKVAGWIKKTDGWECDLLLAAVPPWAWRSLEAQDSFLIPDWVEGEVCLPTFMSERPSSSRASDLRRIRKYGLQATVKERPSDIGLFYNTMHHPFILKTHQDLAELVPYQEMAERFYTSDLLLVQQDGIAIGGIGIDYSPAIPRLFALGIREPIAVNRNLGVVAAAYHFALERLALQGYAKANMGYSRPFLDDGVLHYKRKLGAQICGCYDQYTLLRVLRRSEAAQKFLENSPFIHRIINGHSEPALHGSLFFNSKTIREESINLRKRYAFEGLDSLIFHLWPESAMAVDGEEA